jgi:RNA polymerase sigma factor (sigma-70 family)
MLVPRHVPMLDDSTMQSIGLEAKRFVRRMKCRRIEYEDLFQELFLHVLSHKQTYDSNLGAWSTFVACIIRRKLTSIHRLFNSQTGRLIYAVDSINEMVEDSEGERHELSASIEQGNTPRRSFEEQRSETHVWERQTDVQQVVKVLDDQHRVFCHQMSECETRLEVSQSLGICRSTFYRKLRQVKQVFIESGFDSE